MHQAGADSKKRLMGQTTVSLSIGNQLIRKSFTAKLAQRWSETEYLCLIILNKAGELFVIKSFIIYPPPFLCPCRFLTAVIRL